MGTTPSWSPAVVGQIAQAGQADQFLSSHLYSLTYQGVGQVNNGVSTSGVQEYLTGTVNGTINTNTGSVAQWISQPFITASAQTSITRVALAFLPTGTGADTTVSIQTNVGNGATGTGGVPSGTVLASVVLPSDFTSAIYTSTGGTTYGVSSVTDSGGNFPYYGGTAIIFGWVLAAGGNYAVVTATGAAATNSVTTTAWSPSQPGNTVPYKAYPLISLPLACSNLAVSTKYHIVISGTSSTSNYTMIPTSATATTPAQTSSTGSEPWVKTSNTALFAVFADSPGTQTSSSLRNIVEDLGVRWTALDVAPNHPRPLIVREYSGTQRSVRLLAYTSGLLTSIT